MMLLKEIKSISSIIQIRLSEQCFGMARAEKNFVVEVLPI